MLNFNEFAKEVHQNAVEHGWWDEERSFGEVIALCHSELSEALEEYRNGHALTEIYYRDDGKPEGVPVELADVIIRVLDFCGKHGVNISPLNENPDGWDAVAQDYKKTPVRFGDFITDTHGAFSSLYRECFGDRFSPFGYETIIGIIASVYGYALHNGIDIEAIIMEKHAYNKTRPHKHGGKVI